MFAKKNSVLCLAVTLALAACGGGSSHSPVTATPTPGPVAASTSGKAVDGYLSGSTVFCDLNKNGVADTGEAHTITDANGNYTFAEGCSATVVAVGGTDVTTGYDFKGTLTAPAGSAVVTPLTSLLADSGLTAVQLASALNLATGTDVTQVDPADGNHNDLLRANLAVQQFLQQLANTLGTLSGSTDIAGLHAKVAKALAAALLAAPGTPLFAADGSVNQTVLNDAAKGAVTATLADAKYGKFTISDADLAAAVAQISEQSKAFLRASDADLTTAAKSLQNPNRPAIETKATVNYVALANDSLRINDMPVTIATLASGATVSSPKTIGLDFAIKGTPAIDTVANLALELKEVGGQGRVLQLMIEKVDIKNTAGQLSIAPEQTAKVYVYGHTGSGSDINLTLTDLGFKPLTVVNNSLTLNYTSLVDKVLASVDTGTKTTAEKFTVISGKFDVKLAVEGLGVRTLDGTAPLASTTVTVNNSKHSVQGVGVAGSLTVQ